MKQLSVGSNRNLRAYRKVFSHLQLIGASKFAGENIVAIFM